MEYKPKSQDEQNKDLEILSRLRWRPGVYFDQLQLRNKLVDVDTYDKVNVADREFSQRRWDGACKMVGKCDLQHLTAIHAYLFQDIYYFAGKLRNVSMEINSDTVFVGPQELPERLKKFFTDLKKEKNLKGLEKDKFVERMAEYLTDINILHPFREGNGRTKRVFFQELARQAGYDLDWGKCSKEEWKDADKEAFSSSMKKRRNTAKLRELLDRAIELITLKKKTTSAWQEYMDTPMKEQPKKGAGMAANRKSSNFME